MPGLKIDRDEEEEFWSGGLQGLARRGANVTIHVAGFDAAVSGRLVFASEEAVVVEDPDASRGPRLGHVSWVPRERAVLIQLECEHVDTAAELRARVEADTELLERVRTVCDRYARSTWQAGYTRFRGPAVRVVAGELEDVDFQTVSAAMDVLIERGEVTVEKLP
jgi:hypothetical protein